MSVPVAGAEVVVVGSGFGGSVAALRLAEKGYRVTVLEAGRRFADADLASSGWQLHRIVWAPRLGLRGILRVRIRRGLMVVCGIGVGGGSLAYAGVHYRPEPEAFDTAGWDRSVDWAAQLDPHFARAERMLGTTTSPRISHGDRVLLRTAETLGASDTFHLTKVGVHFGRPNQTIPDPYLGGLGPDRTGCTDCGMCVIGCSTGAKNSLPKNYLHLAERAGACIHPLTTVTALRPRPEGGWNIHSGRNLVWRADQVVLAAGAWGTTELLHRSRRYLPRLSEALGTRVGTNGELILAATAKSFDVGGGVAISSAFHPDDVTTTQLCRIGRGLHPLAVGRGQRAAFLNTMTRGESTLNSYYRRRMRFRGAVVPVDGRTTANAFADHIDGRVHRVWAALSRTPVTAHLLGGCPLGTDPATSVADCLHRVHGYSTLHIADASVIPGNLGVNPALTITAMAERAFAAWEPR